MVRIEDRFLTDESLKFTLGSAQLLVDRQSWGLLLDVLHGLSVRVRERARKEAEASE